jgi:hypothetical protein
MNRVTLHFRPRRVPECPCCVARREHERLKVICLSIEADANDVIDFHVPSVERLAGTADRDDFEDGDGSPMIRCFVGLSIDPAPLTADLRAHTVAELRAMSRELADAADSVEGGAA